MEIFSHVGWPLPPARCHHGHGARKHRVHRKAWVRESQLSTHASLAPAQDLRFKPAVRAAALHQCLKHRQAAHEMLAYPKRVEGGRERGQGGEGGGGGRGGGEGGERGGRGGGEGEERGRRGAEPILCGPTRQARGYWEVLLHTLFHVLGRSPQAPWF